MFCAICVASMPVQSGYPTAIRQLGALIGIRKQPALLSDIPIRLSESANFQFEDARGWRVSGMTCCSDKSHSVKISDATDGSGATNCP
jgi:hypothetical protein